MLGWMWCWFARLWFFLRLRHAFVVVGELV